MKSAMRSNVTLKGIRFARGMRSNRLLPSLWVLILGIVLSYSSSLAGQDKSTKDGALALEKLQGKFTFVVLGDNRDGKGVYQRLLAKAIERKPDFVINTGDQIDKPGDMEEWAEFWEMSKIVKVPYFLTVGNHDVRDAKSEEIYREQVDLPGNELYYSFTAGTCLFVVLDSYLTDEHKKITGKQYEWLEGLLSKSTAKHKFIILHHPLYPEKGQGSHFGDCLDAYPVDRNKLAALLVKHNVGMVFCGHEHYYLRKMVDGIQQVIIGGGGAPLYAGDEKGGYYHYILVTVDGATISAEVVDIDGKIRDTF